MFPASFSTKKQYLISDFVQCYFGPSLLIFLDDFLQKKKRRQMYGLDLEAPSNSLLEGADMIADLNI